MKKTQNKGYYAVQEQDLGTVFLLSEPAVPLFGHAASCRCCTADISLLLCINCVSSSENPQNCCNQSCSFWFKYVPKSFVGWNFAPDPLLKLSLVLHRFSSWFRSAPPRGTVGVGTNKGWEPSHFSNRSDASGTLMGCCLLQRIRTFGTNSLPHHVTSAQSLPVFCSRLKTHLFSRSFR